MATCSSTGKKPEVIEKEKLILDFGDSFVLDEYLRTLPFYHACCCTMPSNSNTLFSLLFYRILADKKAYCYAQTWWPEIMQASCSRMQSCTARG